MDDDDDYDEPPVPRRRGDDRDPRDRRGTGRDVQDIRYQAANPYTSASSQPVYAPLSGYAPAPGYPSPVYPQGAPTPQQGSAYAVSGYRVQGFPAVTRPGITESNYTHGSEYGSASDSYARQGGGYQGPPLQGPPRTDIRDGRPYPVSSRMESREPRIDPRAEPRYTAYASPPGDVPMGGMDYDYPSQSSVLSSSGYSGQARPAPSPYDRDSPGIPSREPYRHELPREERRRERR